MDDAGVPTVTHHESSGYNSDAPVDDPRRDLFRRWPFAQRIAQAIRQHQDPSSLIISVNGPWGDGKTTVLNFVRIALSDDPRIVVINFNPWRYGDEDKLLIGFFTSLAEAVDKSLPTLTETIGRIVGKYAVPVAAAFGQADTARAAAEALAVSGVDELRKRTEAILIEQGKRVVVLMDDVDRLEKAEIQSLFRLVKLTADFKYTAYVLAFDDDIVAAALQERYATESHAAGRSFLEKIIQVPLKLPLISKASLVRYCYERVEQAIQDSRITLSEKDVQIYTRIFEGCLAPRLSTPRMANRYANALTFSLEIMRGEVNTVELMLIEGMRVFYPTMYSSIRAKPDMVLGSQGEQNGWGEHGKAAARKLLDELLEQLPEADRPGALTLLHRLFPRTESLYANTGYAPEWNKTWTDEQRVASYIYFPRYFTYVVGEDDISDLALGRFLTALEEGGDVVASSDILRDIVNARNQDNFLLKLDARLAGLGPEASRTLANVLAANGPLFPLTRPFSRMAMVLSDLVDRIDDRAERMEFSKELLRHVEPITLASEILRWLKSDDPGNPRGFSEAEKYQLAGTIGARLRAAVEKGENIIEKYANDLALLLSYATLGTSIDATTQTVVVVLKAHPETVSDLLRTFVPRPTVMATGLPADADFERREYGELARVIDPAAIAAVLSENYVELRYKEYPSYRVLRDESVFVQEFLWIHKRVLEEKSAKADVAAT